jgi:hypothetical protein
VVLNEVDFCSLFWAEGVDPLGGLPPSRNHNVGIGNIVVSDGTPDIKNAMINSAAIKMRRNGRRIDRLAAPLQPRSKLLPQRPRLGRRRNDANGMTHLHEFACVDANDPGAPTH